MINRENEPPRRWSLEEEIVDIPPKSRLRHLLFLIGIPGCPILFGLNFHFLFPCFIEDNFGWEQWIAGYLMRMFMSSLCGVFIGYQFLRLMGYYD